MDLDKLYTFYLENQLVSIDTRKIEIGSIFIALKGQNFNGNIFADKAIELGAKIAVVDEKKFENKSKGIFYVENNLSCLQELARFHRKKLSIPVIGLTGSNGKTTTKELIANVLKQKFSVFNTQGNLNNHIGVPLSILSIKPHHNIAVIEMGANHQKEIELLSSISMPDIGYITNFGKAHLEGFGGIEGVIKGKSELYQFLKDNHKKALVNLNDKIQIRQSKDIKNIITFGLKDADYCFEIEKSETNFLALKYQNTNIQSNLIGDYNFSNICAAISLGLYFSIPIEAIKYGIESYFPTNMRSQVIKKENKQIVLDAYNANPSSMEVALINFATFDGEKAVILGDMLELGEAEFDEHKKIIIKTIQLNFDLVLLVGERFFKVKINEPNVKQFKSFEELFSFVKTTDLPNNILIKGSRAMTLEKVVEIIN